MYIALLLVGNTTQNFIAFSPFKASVNDELRFTKSWGQIWYLYTLDSNISIPNQTNLVYKLEAATDLGLPDLSSAFLVHPGLLLGLAYSKANQEASITKTVTDNESHVTGPFPRMENGRWHQRFWPCNDGLSRRFLQEPPTPNPWICDNIDLILSTYLTDARNFKVPGYMTRIKDTPMDRFTGCVCKKRVVFNGGILRVLLW